MSSRSARINELTQSAAESVLAPPSVGPAIAAMTFRERDFAVPAGESSEDVTAVRHLLSALFLHPDPPPPELRAQAEVLALAVLGLAEHVCALIVRASGTEPSAADVARTQRGLALSSTQLRALSGDGSTEALAAIATDDLDASSWDATPLLRDGQAWIVVEPHALLIALRHRLIALADEYEWRNDFADRIAESYLTVIPHMLRRLNWESTQMTVEGSAPAAHRIWSFGIDAAVLVTVLFDDLRDYDSTEPDATWPAYEYIETVTETGDRVLRSLFEGEGAPKRGMHLVVLAGVGRPAMWADAVPDAVLQAPRVSMFAGDLEFVSFAEQGDPLALWRFGLDADRLEAQILSEDPLETFALWRFNTHSFYLGDERRPTVITSVGRAAELRREVAHDIDRHGVILPGGRRLVEVVRRFSDLHVPLYRTLYAALPGVIVDADGMVCWVRPSDGGREVGQLVDAVAFWMWQLLDELDIPELEIDVEVGHPLSVRQSGPGRLKVRVDPRQQPELQRADNQGERMLVVALLRALTGEADDGIVDRVAPLGLKKMILAFDLHSEASLDGASLPPRRDPLRDSDDGQAMDELGVYLREELGRPVGPIATDQRVEVLDAAVAFHREQLLSLIATLNPDGLLETLIAVNERHLYDSAFGRYTLPTQMTCFGQAAGIERRLRSDLERQGSSGTALRFVIECVAARPPSGIRPLTLPVQDRLVALACQVVARGSIAEAIRERLDDARVSILPSGRLGVGRDAAFVAGRERFGAHFQAAEIRRSHEHFPSLFASEETEEEAAIDADLLNAASEHEWGATAGEILELFGALVDLSEGDPVVVIDLDDAAETLAEMLTWEVDKVLSVLEHFALRARDDVWRPQAPYKTHDVMPWRYGRRLSLVRRPMVIRPGEDGDELVYGFRAVDSAGRQLIHEIETARLKVETEPMRDAISKLRQRSDLRFNRRIADLFRGVDGVIVRERVKTVGRVDITRPNGDRLGDVDVLVADPQRRVLEVIDTKNLAVGRTPIEVARELRRTFVSHGCQSAAADKHAERATWIEEHRPEVLAWLGLDDANALEWTVEPSIVVDQEVQAPFIRDVGMTVLDAAAVAESLERPGDDDLDAVA